MIIVSAVFAITMILVFVLLAFTHGLAAFLPVMYFYFITTIVGLLPLNYIGTTICKAKITIVYPISFALSFLILAGTISWLSGNTFTNVLIDVFSNRNNIFSLSLSDPYIIANVITYILVVRGVSRPSSLFNTTKPL